MRISKLNCHPRMTAITRVVCLLFARAKGITGKREEKKYASIAARYGF